MTDFPTRTFYGPAGTITGALVAETILVYMVKPKGMPVQTLEKKQWSMTPDMQNFADIFSFFGGRP